MPQLTVSVVLFVWGPGRIVPVRVTSLAFTEKIYDGLLNPTHVDAKIALRILTPDELDHLSGPLKEICKGAYAYSQGLRQALATTKDFPGVTGRTTINAQRDANKDAAIITVKAGQLKFVETIRP